MRVPSISSCSNWKKKTKMQQNNLREIYNKKIERRICIHLFVPYFTSEKNGGEFIKYDIKE